MKKNAFGEYNSALRFLERRLKKHPSRQLSKYRVYVYEFTSHTHHVILLSANR